MSQINLSSAHSDDGKIKNRSRQQDSEQEFDDHRNQRNRVLDDAARLSVTAELSAHDNVNAQRPDEDPISERPEEDDRASSPAGTIGD